jgi:hypothetical protein
MKSFLSNILNKSRPDLSCPYGCGFAFETMPTRRRKCPQCKKTIYLSRLPFETKKTLMTEEAGIRVALENEGLRILLNLEAKPERALKKKFMKSDSDSYLSRYALDYLEKGIKRALKKNDYSTLGTLANELKNMLRLADKDCTNARNMQFRASLSHAAQMRYTHVEISKCCDCGRPERVVAVKDALENGLLPCCPDWNGTITPLLPSEVPKNLR